MPEDTNILISSFVRGTTLINFKLLQEIIDICKDRIEYNNELYNKPKKEKLKKNKGSIKKYLSKIISSYEKISSDLKDIKDNNDSDSNEVTYDKLVESYISIYFLYNEIKHNIIKLNDGSKVSEKDYSENNYYEEEFSHIEKILTKYEDLSTLPLRKLQGHFAFKESDNGLTYTFKSILPEKLHTKLIEKSVQIANTCEEIYSKIEKFSDLKLDDYYIDFADDYLIFIEYFNLLVNEIKNSNKNDETQKMVNKMLQFYLTEEIMLKYDKKIKDIKVAIEKQLEERLKLNNENSLNINTKKTNYDSDNYTGEEASSSSQSYVYEEDEKTIKSSTFDQYEKNGALSSNQWFSDEGREVDKKIIKKIISFVLDEIDFINKIQNIFKRADDPKIKLILSQEKNKQILLEVARFYWQIKIDFEKPKDNIFTYSKLIQLYSNISLLILKLYKLNEKKIGFTLMTFEFIPYQIEKIQVLFQIFQELSSLNEKKLQEQIYYLNIKDDVRIMFLSPVTNLIDKHQRMFEKKISNYTSKIDKYPNIQADIRSRCEKLLNKYYNGFDMYLRQLSKEISYINFIILKRMNKIFDENFKVSQQHDSSNQQKSLNNVELMKKFLTALDLQDIYLNELKNDTDYINAFSDCMNKIALQYLRYYQALEMILQYIQEINFINNFIDQKIIRMKETKTLELTENGFLQNEDSTSVSDDKEFSLSSNSEEGNFLNNKLDQSEESNSSRDHSGENSDSEKNDTKENSNGNEFTENNSTKSEDDEVSIEQIKKQIKRLQIEEENKRKKILREEKLLSSVNDARFPGVLKLTGNCSYSASRIVISKEQIKKHIGTIHKIMDPLSKEVDYQDLINLIIGLGGVIEVPSKGGSHRNVKFKDDKGNTIFVCTIVQPHGGKGSKIQINSINKFKLLLQESLPKDWCKLAKQNGNSKRSDF